MSSIKFHFINFQKNFKEEGKNFNVKFNLSNGQMPKSEYIKLNYNMSKNR